MQTEIAVSTSFVRYQNHKKPEVSTLSGRYESHSREDYVSKFRRLVKRWRQEKAFMSSVDEVMALPSFLEITMMGKKIVPLIIEELENKPDTLVCALPIITGENPVPEELQGKMSAIAAYWSTWASNKQWD